MNFTEEFLEQCKLLLNVFGTNNIEQIDNIADILYQVRENNGRLFIIGSGGGAGHASHAVSDFRKLCHIESYAPYDNISELTARVNDESWETTISNWLVVSNLRENDCIFVISIGGGNIHKKVSMNIVNALIYAKEKKSKIVGIVGRDGGYTKEQGDAVVVLPIVSTENITPITEGFQSVILHLLVSHPKIKINKTTW